MPAASLDRDHGGLQRCDDPHGGVGLLAARQAGRESARGVSKLNTVAQITLAGFALGVRAYGLQEPSFADHPSMDGRRDNSGLWWRLYRPVAGPYEPVAGAMLQSLAAVTVLVPSYDEGLAFFRDVLGFEVLEDTPLSATSAGLSLRHRRARARRSYLPFQATSIRRTCRRPNGGSGRLFSSLWRLLGRL